VLLDFEKADFVDEPAFPLLEPVLADLVFDPVLVLPPAAEPVFPFDADLALEPFEDVDLDPLFGLPRDVEPVPFFSSSSDVPITDETTAIAFSTTFDRAPCGCSRRGVIRLAFWNFAFSDSILSPRASSCSEENWSSTSGNISFSSSLT
jgi:hypothetical protein